MPVSEVELELKRGNSLELYRFARELAAHAPVLLGVKSKAERGYELLAGDALKPVRSPPVRLSPEQTAGDAFKSIARTCLYQLIANVPALLAGDAEGLHQSRVSLRRLRTAASLFSGFLRDKQTNTVKAEMKWLTGEFTAAREMHVFGTRVVDPFANRDGGGLRRLQSEVRDAGTGALSRAHSAVDSPRFRSLVRDIASWIEAGDWTRVPDDMRRTLRELG